MLFNDLHWALTASDESLVREIIGQVPDNDINQVLPGSTRTILGTVTKFGTFSLAQLMIEERHANVNQGDKSGVFPLHIACERGALATVRLFLDAGAVVDVLTNAGHTTLKKACESGHVDIVRLLLYHYTPSPSVEDASLCLLLASRAGYSDLVRTLVPLADITTTDSAGDTALRIAARNGHRDIVSILLGVEAPIDGENTETLMTPLICAVQGANADVVDFLIGKRADAEKLGRGHSTALMYAVHYGGPEIVEVIKRSTRHPNAVNDFGETALHIAAISSCVRTIAAVLGGIDTAVKDHRGMTALYIAARRGNESAVSLFLAHDSAQIDVTENHGFTPLMGAVIGGHVDVVQILLYKGASMQPLTHRGESAIDLARRYQYKVILDILLSPVPQNLLTPETMAESVYPAKSSWPIASVTFRGSLYHGDSFETYPAQWGYDFSDIGADSFFSKLAHPDRLLTFLQSWFIFGLATEVLRTALREYPPVSNRSVSSDYKRRKCHVIDLESLVVDGTVEARIPAKYWGEWQNGAGESCLPVSELRKRADKVRKLLQETHGICERLDVVSETAGSPMSTPEWTSNIFFFTMFGQLLTNLAASVYPKVVQYDDEQRWPEWHMTSRLKNKLEEQGWCSPSIRAMSSNACVDTLYMAAQDQPQTDHSGCTLEECTANHISDDRNYPIWHLGPQGSCCNMVGRSNEAMRRILENGEIPIIPLDVADAPRSQIDGCSDLRVISATTPGTDRFKNYIAISHVWSDGLGNPNENKVCYSQLLEIVRLCKMQNSKVKAFWLDTLCVPLDPTLRKKAIRGMGNVYTKASGVIVLDKTLITIEQPPIPTLSNGGAQEEFALRSLVRIGLSNWTRRLWTIQEGINAERLVFALGSTLVDIDELLTMASGQKLHVEASIVPDCQQIVGFFRKHLNLNDPIDLDELRRRQETERIPFDVSVKLGIKAFEHRLVALFKALELRSTSKPDDETICLASILRLDVSEFLDGTAHERMSRLAQRIQRFPWAVLFTNVPRLPVQGQRWFPASLLHSGVQFNLGKYALVSQRGMHLRTKGFIIHCASMPSRSFWNMTYTSLSDSGDSGINTTKTLLLHILDSKMDIGTTSWNLCQFEVGKRYGLVIQPQFEQNGSVVMNAAISAMGTALIVSDPQREGNTYYASPIVAVTATFTNRLSSWGLPGDGTTRAQNVGLSSWCIG